jgi:hypothetical protein
VILTLFGADPRVRSDAPIPAILHRIRRAIADPGDRGTASLASIALWAIRLHLGFIRSISAI